MQFVQHHGLAGLRTIAALRGWASSSANCSGVVSRISGGAWRWRWRRDRGRVAGAGLHRHRQPHLGDGRFQIARHVHRQRLERRDVERVQARWRATRLGRPARSIRLGRKPARVLPPPVGATSSTLSPALRRSRPAPTDAARSASSRVAANQFSKRGGRRSMTRTLITPQLAAQRRAKLACGRR